MKHKHPRTAEHRAKIAAAAKARWTDPETRAKWVAAMRRGHKQSPEHLAKLSATRRGRKLSPEHKAKISAAGKGRPISQETRAKISQGHKLRLTRCMTPDELRRYRKRNEYAFRLWTRYRVREHDIALLLERQNFRCPCGADVSSLDGKRVSIDHDHRTNAVRGLLCRSCNWRLGQVEAFKETWGWDLVKEYLDG